MNRIYKIQYTLDSIIVDLPLIFKTKYVTASSIRDAEKKFLRSEKKTIKKDKMTVDVIEITKMSIDDIPF